MGKQIAEYIKAMNKSKTGDDRQIQVSNSYIQGAGPKRNQKYFSVIKKNGKFFRGRRNSDKERVFQPYLQNLFWSK